ncbi:MAG TPA: DUF4389 domain-containing protein [Caldisericia bacterium]|jgi:hypothetical protein|nr:DUF4389 domain-containing protein [Caldisericia bacterium]
MTSPVKFNVTYPESLSRGLLLLRLFFGYFYVMIPHGFMLGLYGIALYFVIIIAWFAVLFTGKYPEGMFRFVEGYYRWYLRVMAYMMFMTDQYPPFSQDANPPNYNALEFSVEYPGSLSRGLLLLRLLFGYFYVLIPHGIMLAFYAIGVYFVILIAWFAVLFTGKYPEGMFRFVEKYFRWWLRVGTYMSFMTDQYPPFNGDE